MKPMSECETREVEVTQTTSAVAFYSLETDVMDKNVQLDGRSRWTA